MAIEWRWGDPGWGFSHTPLYVPNFNDPTDVAEHLVGHTVTGAGLAIAARLYAGSWPAGGHLAQLYRALLSPAHIGASYAGTNAWDDTMFALRAYGTPFRYAARVAAPIGAAVLFHDVGTAAEDYVRDKLGLPDRHILGSPMTPEEIAYFN